MDFMNPEAAQNNIHGAIEIFCQSTEQYAFVSHLSAALGREGIYVLVVMDASRDLNQAMISVVVTSETVKVIDPSHMFVEVNERPMDNVIQVDSPVLFYDVNPFVRLYSRANKLLKAGNSTVAHQSRISGNMILTDSDLVEEIVKYVYEKLYRTERVGIYSKLLEIQNLLYKQPGDVRSIGIWGMPGIGKTTLAKAVFNHMSTDYDTSCFIENFDEAFHKEGLHRLLEEKIGKMVKEEFDINMRPRLHRDKLFDKRILVVLDDVRDSMAAESFLGRLEWFAPKSMMIIMTSIDKQVFAFCHINQIYEVQGLNEHEAWQLFSQIAFGKPMLDENVTEVSVKIIDYANGNPLALQIYGQELKGKMSEMKAFLKLKQDPPQKIQGLLKSVYNALDDNEKNIFLDIACFFRGENVNYVVQMLEGFRYLPLIGIDVLVDKSVLTISENTLQMSSLIQDLCQKIFIGETESCARMWEPCSTRRILEDDELKASGESSSAMSKCGLIGEDIESIILDTSNVKFDVKHDAFKNMFNLRFLKIYNSCSKNVHGLNFPKGLNFLPCGLRLLHWENYPLQSLPQNFDPDNLVELCMPYSHLQTLGAGNKNLKMLKRIRLSHSQQLVEFDLFLDAKNIELIDLQGCTRLQSFPDTSELQHLRVVNLSGCKEIKSFQGTPPNIEELHLQGTSVREIPKFIVTHYPQRVKLDRQKLLILLENFQDVEHIDLESVTDLVKVSSYNQGFGKLVHLNMKDCSHLRSLPDMVSLESLQVLLLSGCSELEEIKGFPRNMKRLYLSGTAVRELPQLPQSLEFLNAHDCKYLKSVRMDFEKLPRHYIFSNCFNFSPQVIAEFVEKDLTRVASLAGAKQELIKASEISICIPFGARQRSYFFLQAGPNVTMDLTPWTQKPISGFAMKVVVSFQDDYHNTVGLGIRCICTWKDRNGYSKKIERLFHCWAPTEAPKVQWDHIFIFSDTKMHPSGEENPNLRADEVKFEFHTVSWPENKLMSTNCMVMQCGVNIITAPTNDTRPSEITIESEATASVIEDHPPTSSRIVLEAKSPTPLRSNEPRKDYSAQSKLRSKGTKLWKWMRTTRRDKKNKTLTDREQVDLKPASTSPPTLSSFLKSLHVWGHCFTLRDLEMATNRFSDENVIRKGHKGFLYIGFLNGTPIAVKKFRWRFLDQGEEDLISEVKTIGHVRHKNIACLLGYCIEGTNRMLVYEFVSNGDLQKWLSLGSEDGCFTWEARMKVLIGTSKALAHLHEAIKPKVVHGAITARAILINDEFEAKVSDFSLAKLLPAGENIVETGWRNKSEYVAPEYVSTGKLSEKNDVYSFGVVLLEVITGRRPNYKGNLVEWSKMMVDTRRSGEVLDPNIEVKPPAISVKQALLTALRCVDPDSDKRPKMSQVVDMLESEYLIPTEVTSITEHENPPGIMVEAKREP